MRKMNSLVATLVSILVATSCSTVYAKGGRGKKSPRPTPITTFAPTPGPTPIPTPIPTLGPTLDPAPGPALANPERGFYRMYTYKASVGGPLLDPVQLIDQRENEGMSLILRLFYLDDATTSSGVVSFRNGANLTQHLLDHISTDFITAREAGVKCIVRFAYVDGNDHDGGATEPPLAAALWHIAQLTPYLQAASDVITVVQAGFIGLWGEWHSSTNFPDDDKAGRGAVVAALLDALPDDKIVQLRTPAYKKLLYEVTVDGPFTSGYLIDPSFELSSPSWEQFGSNSFSVTTEASRTGSKSCKVTSGAASQTITSSQNDFVAAAGKMITISGYSMADNVPQTITNPADYSIYADVQFDDGTWSYGQTANFKGRGETTDWEYAERRFFVPQGKTAVFMSIYAMYRNQASGAAYFDDMNVTVSDAPVLVAGAALNSTTAHLGTHISRTGHHNDCFLASDTDFGTYVDGSKGEYPYLSDDTKFTAMGGETCHVNKPRSDCATAMEELALFHYTYMHRDYNILVLDNWSTENCFDEIWNKLGYRLLVAGATYPNQAMRSELLPVSIDLRNDGYAAPVNRRRVQVVLRNVRTGVLCAATFGNDVASADARTWYGGGSTHSLKANLNVNVAASEVPMGIYRLFLHLADPSPALWNRLEYKIQVANNPDINEAATGLIDLGHDVTIAAATSSSNMPIAGAPTLDVLCGVEGDILPPTM